MLKNKQGELSLIPLLALFFGSVLVVSAVVVNSTDNSSLDMLNNSIIENFSLNSTLPSDNLTLNESPNVDLTLPTENISLENQTINLTLPENISLNVSLPEKQIKNLTEIIEKNKHKLNNETEDYLKHVKNKKEEKEFIIKFRSSINDSKLVNITLDKRIDKFKLTKVKGEVEDIEDLIEDSEIEFLELEQNVEILGENIPSNVIKVKADSVWNLSNGSGVKIAVLDTGINLHDDLAIVGGVSFVDTNYYDSNGHGTAVAGVIAALLNNGGLVGIAPSVDLYSVKIMQSSTGDLSNAISGIGWAIDNKIDIVSMSFGFGSYSQIFKEVLQEAYNNNILLVAASGNNGQDNILYPAKYDTVIAVGAVDENNNLASFSSYGFEQELVAPGVYINSTSLGNGYGVSSGTSLAAPHVAGTAALIKSFNSSLTNEQIRAKLRNDALDLGSAGKDDLFGYGLIQVNLQTNNFTITNFSYFYEIFNITDYGLPNQTHLFWLNGTGTIDDVDFGLGYYLIKKYLNQKIIEEIVLVTENGTIFLTFLGGEHTYSDGYSVHGTTSDAFVWKNGNIDAKFSNQESTLHLGVICFDYNSPASFSRDHCWAYNAANLTDCRLAFSDLNTFCNTPGNCDDTGVNEFHDLGSVSIAERRTLSTLAYYNCTFSVLLKDADTVSSTYNIIDKLKPVCTGGANYKIQGSSDTWRDIKSYTCSTNKECDTLADEQEETSSTVDLSQESNSKNPCRVSDGFACTIDSNCLTGHFCVNGLCSATLPATNICNGTISAIVTDSKSNPLTNARIYRNGIFNGSVDNDGSRTINFTNVDCGSSQTIEAKCSDDTLCDTKSTSIDSNGDYDSLSFTCNVCINKTDLSIKTSDVTVKSQGNKQNITALINVEKVSASNVVVDFRGTNTQSGKTTINESKTISVSQYVNQNVSVLWDTNSTDFVSITVDFTNVVAETDDKNNYVKKSTRDPINAYIEVSTDYSVLSSTIKNFLGQYVNEVSSGQDVNIYIGRKNSNIPKVMQTIGKENTRWGLINNIVNFNAKSEGLPYNGIVVRSGTNIYVFGNEIDGDVAALRKLVDNQEFYFSKTVTERIDYIDESDLDGLFVFDYLHTDENQAKYRKNNANFAKVVENVLNSDVSTLAIKRVLTYNDNTSLRIKHVNAELGPKYKNFSNPQPVVLQRGIHSNLFTWEDFGFDLARGQVAGAKDNKPRDVWLTELVGGPNTECTNCPVYTFDNLSTYYWPALIAGVQKYSNQNNLSYVGFSLGCSVALDSLEKYNIIGKTLAGYYNNGSDWVNMSMSAYPIDTFVGIACPGNFTKLSTTWIILNSSKSFVFDHFRKVGKNHTNLDEIKRRVLFEYQIIASLLLGQEYYQIIDNIKNSLDSAFPLGGSNMSIEIYYEFFRWMNDSDGPHLGKNVSINNVAIFQGEISRKLSLISSERNTDTIVPTADLKEICQNINSSNKYYVNFPNRYHFGKEGIVQSLPEDKEVQSVIKKFLDTKVVTDSLIGSLLGKNNYEIISDNVNCD